MKVYPNQLAKQLKSELAPIYVISGDEPLLVQEARDEVIATAKRKGFTGHEFHQVNKDFKWQSLYAATHSMSLFDDQSIIELRWTSAKPGTAGASALTDYCKNLVNDKILLIVAPKMDAATQRSKWYKALDEQGVTVPVWPIDSSQLPKWVAERMKLAELSSDGAGIKVIIDATEGNLLATAQEIEKLRLLYGPGRLSSTQIASAIADNARFDVFKLVDTIHAGQGAAVIRVISRLQQEGCEPTLILWALVRELRMLANIHHLVKSGDSAASAFKKNGVWDKRQALVKQSLNRLSSSKIYNLILKASYLDRNIKGLRTGNTWDEVASLSINMAIGL